MISQTEDLIAEDEGILERLFSETIQADISKMKESPDNPLVTENVLIEDVILLDNSMPNNFINLSIINVIFSFYLGTGALFLALLALYFSLRTYEYNSEEKFEMASVSSQYAVTLNFATMFVIMAGYLLALLELYSWENWTWGMPYF